MFLNLKPEPISAEYLCSCAKITKNDYDEYTKYRKGFNNLNSKGFLSNKHLRPIEASQEESKTISHKLKSNTYHRLQRLISDTL